MAEEQAFQSLEGTVEHIFNFRVITKKHLHHQSFSTTSLPSGKFSTSFHSILREFNRDEGLVQVTHELFGNASKAVLLNRQKDIF
ncbi:hypothetical protein DPMN_028900 [Dreissena polymorpha]|uniref:Uncharacterized protein n=1 Tax=Dreissena polymorpha TaxID=45954 RepID=A0A9D4LZS1_DREPO|nr:hypothetical protein DPMN_028900 [Dreissena polymorpha]